MLKRLFACLLCIILCTGLACAESGDDEMIQRAMDVLWNRWLADSEAVGFEPYLRIMNTRVVELADNDVDLFEGMEAIVEFVIYTDYLNNAPYYVEPNVYDSVAVYADGSYAVPTFSLFERYRSKYYEIDYSKLIERVTDYYDAYNCEFRAIEE